MDLFHKKYRIDSTRLKNWDYRSNALYFVTICSWQKEHLFGEIRDGEMLLIEIGQIVEMEWSRTLKVRPDMNLTLDEFVVMHNHFHGIICIGKNEFNKWRNTNNYEHGPDSRDGMPSVSTHTGHLPNTFGPQSKSLGSVIRGFKSSVTIESKKIISYFKWQDRFHEHMIRNEEEYFKIRNYIINNPRNWEEDKFYSPQIGTQHNENITPVSRDGKHSVSTLTGPNHIGTQKNENVTQVSRDGMLSVSAHTRPNHIGTQNNENATQVSRDGKHSVSVHTDPNNTDTQHNENATPDSRDGKLSVSTNSLIKTKNQK
jgi:putative transposase